MKSPEKKCLQQLLHSQITPKQMHALKGGNGDTTDADDGIIIDIISI